MRRSTMVAVQKGAERLGFDPSMHAKRIVTHRGEGHGTREGYYEDTTATTDIGAMLMQRQVEAIEGLANVATTRCPELRKYQTPQDVPQRDPLWKLLHKNEGLQALKKAVERLGTTPENELSEADCGRLALLQREIRGVEWQLKRQVLFEKRKAVYDSHCEALKVMPLEAVQALRAVNTYEGVSLRVLCCSATAADWR